MNPITVFLTFACIAVGVAFGATGHLYRGVPFVWPRSSSRLR